MRLRIACAVAFVTLFVQGEGARDHLRALGGCNGKGGHCSKNKDCCESEGLSCGGGGKCGGCNAEGVKCDTNGDCCEGLSCGVGGQCTTCNGEGGNCQSDGNCCGDLVCGGAWLTAQYQKCETTGDPYTTEWGAV